MAAREDGAGAVGGERDAARLGPYVLLGELGRGGMGVVYRARREDLRHDYALKVILPGQDASPDAVAWSRALDDDLRRLVRDGRSDEARRRLRQRLGAA